MNREGKKCVLYPRVGKLTFKGTMEEDEFHVWVMEDWKILGIAVFS